MRKKITRLFTPKRIVAFVLLLFLLLIPLPYYLYMPGGAKDVSNYVNVDNGNEAEGQFMLTYIHLPKANASLMAYAFFSDRVKIIPKKQLQNRGENESDRDFRDEMNIRSSFSNAAMVALKYAGIPYEIKEYHSYIVLVSENLTVMGEGEVLVGDELLLVDGKEITELDKLKEYINEEKREMVSLTLKRNDELIDVALKVFEVENVQYIGVSILTEYIIESVPVVNFDRQLLSGPSAGLMMALEIYNQLTNEDITKGLNIAGTGTIDPDGNVGEIGGAEFKVYSADKAGADLFFLPYKQEERIEGLEDIKVVRVKTFEEALRYLKNLE